MIEYEKKKKRLKHKLWGNKRKKKTLNSIGESLGDQEQNNE